MTSTSDGSTAKRRFPWHDMILVCAVMVAYSWFYNGGSANQHSRYGMILAFVEPGQSSGLSFNINRFARPGNGRRYSNTSDWSNNPRHDQNLYSNKAPGIGLAGIPFYAILYGIERGLGCDPLEIETTYLNFYLLNILLTILPCALSAPFLLRIIRRLLPHPQLAWLITTTFYFGTLMLPFSTQLWGHTTAAAMLIFFLFFWQKEKLYLAGAFLGAAVLCEYSCILPAIIYLCYLLITNRVGAARLVSGALPLALIYLAYHWLAFGNPFLPATFFNNPRFIHDGRLFSLAHLTTVIWHLTLSPYRGLLWYMPVLLLAFLPLLQGRKAAGDPELALAGLSALAFFVMNLLFTGWHGGASTGPRYMIPALPLFAVLIAKGIDHICRSSSHTQRRLVLGAGLALALASVTNMWVIASVTPMAKPASLQESKDRENQVWRNPLRFFYISVSKGFIQPLGRELRPFRAGEPHFTGYRFKSFNLGGLMGISGAAQSVPCLVIILAMSLVFLHKRTAVSSSQGIEDQQS